MVLGLVGIGIGFMTAPKTTQDIEAMIAANNHNAGEDHAVADEHATADTHKVDTHGDAQASADHNEHQEHLDHLLHQAKNKPWSAFFIAAFFFFMLALLALVFYAIQWASQAGWSIVLYRVMESITSFLLPASFFLLLFLILSTSGFNEIFVWMGEDAKLDPVLVEKAPWLNKTGFLLRSFVFVAGWNIFRFFLRKNSLALDEAGEMKIYKRNFNISVGFLAFFIVTELFFVFDLTMSLDPHWFSQLYPFYVFASMLVTAITTIAVIAIYLKGKGYLPEVNNSHLHDLAKFMFGFSIFWTYFFFDQFMLQWYSNQPEEAVYFVPRLLGTYQLPFMGMLILNFVFPILILMSSDFKRLNWFIMMAGISIIVGHYIDVFILIAPATVGDSWSIGLPEIASLVFFLGMFIFVVFRSLSKAPLQAKGNPFMKESEIYHY
jgi:hypothetical protein